MVVRCLSKIVTIVTNVDPNDVQLEPVVAHCWHLCRTTCKPVAIGTVLAASFDPMVGPDVVQIVASRFCER